MGCATVGVGRGGSRVNSPSTSIRTSFVLDTNTCSHVTTPPLTPCSKNVRLTCDQKLVKASLIYRTEPKQNRICVSVGEGWLAVDLATLYCRGFDSRSFFYCRVTSLRSVHIYHSFHLISSDLISSEPSASWLTPSTAIWVVRRDATQFAVVVTSHSALNS